MLFSEPKIPQWVERCVLYRTEDVSVLFSEPKIPQCEEQKFLAFNTILFQCSSASRKFLNFSALPHPDDQRKRFQCSSASRKFLNLSPVRVGGRSAGSFSALQRAENSSIDPVAALATQIGCFSALQRAENSSINPTAFRAPQ